MVFGKPYIHFKINNEAVEIAPDYNYTWATTVECEKGPVNEPVLINDANQAMAIFGVDMRPYFAQGATSLIMVRVAGSDDIDTPKKGVFDFITEEDITIYRAEQYIKEETIGNKTYKYKMFLARRNNSVIPVVEHKNATTKRIVPQEYVDDWNDDGTAKTGCNVYTSNEVQPWLQVQAYPIDAGKSLFYVTSKYEGDYGLTVSIINSDVNNEGDNRRHYHIVLNDPALGSTRLNNVFSIKKIINRINDGNLNFVASATNDGAKLMEAMTAPITTVTIDSLDGVPYIDEAIPVNTIISLKADGTTYATVGDETKDYDINLATCLKAPLLGSSNGPWDADKGRISIDFQGQAHEEGLKLLRRLRIAGIFCMYEETAIQDAYIKHGYDPDEPEKGMNNNETCKWRTIILGAEKIDRDSKSELAVKAATLNNQYILYLGQGLIDTGYNGDAMRMSAKEKSDNGIVDDHQLLPYECTQYIAGLRSKLTYDESIFGGQGRKRIRSIGDLSIAPLFNDGRPYEWDPLTYTYLNEYGVLTFTEDYGNITLTDGVTTCQTGFEEDEEGVMNILKYAQNGIYDLCLPYIGRNINADLQQGLSMEIQSFLETMKTSHQSLIDTDEFAAYEFDVSLGARSTQLLGKIFITLRITPVHALRQIEVEMTVQ